ncbi:trigger factor [Candidatus Peregrinibacteria bacterium]|nr:trigger factor [Candidatus Peregrinibacteria bacterium]
MELDIKKLPKSEAEINATLTENDFKKDLEQAAEEISKEVKIPGFRPGKVPYDVLLQHVGKELVMNHALDSAIPRVLTDAIKKENLQVVARPKVEVVSLEPLKFKAVLALYPEIKIAGYEKVKIKPKQVKVEEKDIDDAVKNFQKEMVAWKSTENLSEKGDKVEIDFEGFDEGGASLEGTKSLNHPLIIGEQMMVPGFEDNLIGLKPGEIKEFTLTFPKDYHKTNFQNKKVKFNVKVNKILRPSYPDIDDEFVSKYLGEGKKVADFRDTVSKDLSQYRQMQEKKRQENELFEKFLSLIKVDFSDILVDEEVEYILHEMKHDMSHHGLKFEDYLAHMKKTEEEIRKELRKEAEKRLTLRFGLNEIMEKEKIEAKEEEINEEINKLGMDGKSKEDHGIRAKAANSIRLSKLYERFIEK